MGWLVGAGAGERSGKAKECSRGGVVGGLTGGCGHLGCALR